MIDFGPKWVVLGVFFLHPHKMLANKFMFTMIFFYDTVPLKCQAVLIV
jgi:hypothetical protein